MCADGQYGKSRRAGGRTRDRPYSLEHAFFKGTTHRKAFHINCRLENLGGELNAYTTKEETVIHTTSLRGDFAKAAELIADIVFHSVFPEKELEKEKDIVLDEINSYKDTPSERIFDDFEDMIFKGSSLGHNILGTKASLMKHSREDLFRFVERTYNTDQMVFSVIGNISEKRFREICEHRYFAGPAASARQFTRDQAGIYVPETKTTIAATAIRPTASWAAGRRVRERRKANRAGRCSTTWSGGPSANSLLNLAVRERKGLSYNIESGFSPFSDTGIATDLLRHGQRQDRRVHGGHRPGTGTHPDRRIRAAGRRPWPKNSTSDRSP